MHVFGHAERAIQTSMLETSITTSNDHKHSMRIGYNLRNSNTVVCVDHGPASELHYRCVGRVCQTATSQKLGRYQNMCECRGVADHAFVRGGQQIACARSSRSSL